MKADAKHVCIMEAVDELGDATQASQSRGKMQERL